MEKTIAEIKAMRFELEKQLVRLVGNFEVEVGIHIERINLNRKEVFNEGGEVVLSELFLETELKL